jgi:hypothetical protein
MADGKALKTVADDIYTLPFAAAAADPRREPGYRRAAITVRLAGDKSP